MFQVIMYAALAVIVCVLLYSVLGKDVGMGPDDAIKFEPKTPKVVAPANVAPAFDPEAERTGLSAVHAADPDFSLPQFMDGATAAYSMILEAYASGDRDLLKDLLTSDVFEVYDAAITAREAAGQTQVTDLGRLRKASIKEASVDGKLARIAILYEADLTSALLDESGAVVLGDPDVLSSISEVWEYERNMKSSDPNWRLADVVPNEGDDLEADPSPDTKASKPKSSGKKPAGKKPTGKKPAGKKPSGKST